LKRRRRVMMMIRRRRRRVDRWRRSQELGREVCRVDAGLVGRPTTIVDIYIYAVVDW